MKDQSGAAVENAKVEISNPVTGLQRSTATGADGAFRFTNLPFNLTNKEALYNFLSTFSGTHFVTPRSETVELGFHF